MIALTRHRNISSLIPTENTLHRHHFTHLSDMPSVDWCSLLFHDVIPALVKLFKHLWPVVCFFLFFIYSPRLESNYGEISLWQSMTLDLDTHCFAQNTQSHKLVVLVAALSGAREDSNIYYTTISLLLYLEKTAVGAFSSSLSHYKCNERAIFILNDKKKKNLDL